MMIGGILSILAPAIGYIESKVGKNISKILYTGILFAIVDSLLTAFVGLLKGFSLLLSLLLVFVVATVFLFSFGNKYDIKEATSILAGITMLIVMMIMLSVVGVIPIHTAGLVNVGLGDILFIISYDIVMVYLGAAVSVMLEKM